MQIRSDSFANGQPIPAEFALGAPDGFGGNRNPHLSWSDVPDGTRSFALLCIDADAPSDASLAGPGKADIPVDHVRGDFVHWVLVDIPADTRGIAAGSVSAGPVTGGKPADADHGPGRAGLNDYTGWFAGDDGMRGDYHGYDGPYPPPNDLRTHRYFFRLFALDVATLPLPQRFTAADVFTAMHGHILDETAIHGTYALHPGVRS